MKKKLLIKAIAVIAICLVGNTIFSSSVFAGYTNNVLAYKSYAQGLYYCLQGGERTKLSDRPQAGTILDRDVVTNVFGGIGQPGDKQVYSPISESQISSLLDTNGAVPQRMPLTGVVFPYLNADETIFVPNGLTPEQGGTNNNAATNCHSLVNGRTGDAANRVYYSSNKYNGDGFTDSIADRLKLDVSVPHLSDRREDIDTFMTGIGYEKHADPNDKTGRYCYNISYQVRPMSLVLGESIQAGAYYTHGDNKESIFTTWDFCVDLDKEGKIEDTHNGTTYNVTGTDVKISNYLFVRAEGGLLWFVKSLSTSVNLQNCTNNLNNCDSAVGSVVISKLDDLGYGVGVQRTAGDAVNVLGLTLEQFEDVLTVIISEMNYEKLDKDDSNPEYFNGDISYNVPAGSTKGVVFNGNSFNKYQAGGGDSFVWEIGSDAPKKSIEFLNSHSRLDSNEKPGASFGGVAVTGAQKIVLYQYYVGKVANGIVKCDVEKEETDWIEVEWFESTSEKKKCYVTTYRRDNTLYSVVEDSGYYTKQVGIEELLTYLHYPDRDITGKVDPTDIITSATTQMNSIYGDGGQLDEEASCYDNSSGLGIIFCPIISVGSSFIQGFYKDHIETQLSMNPVLLNLNPNSEDYNKEVATSVYGSWSIFQGFGNVAFIGIFLFVILSQLTGFGLDNYGVKKVLPKLIIGAILINLSFIISQVIMDTANISGGALKGVFENVGGITEEIKLAEGGTGTAVGSWGILIALIGLVSAGSILAVGPAVLVPVFMVIVTVVVAVISLFIMLALRTSLAVVLVVISPLAFLCYILPNTKGLFSKWFTLFKGVLLAYPLCSAMVYGGQAVSRIMVIAMGTGRLPFSMALAAAAMSIAPIFLIPSVLKKSMAAINGTVSTLSNRFGNAVKKRGQNSNLAADLNERGKLQRAGIKVNKDGIPVTSKSGKWKEKFAITKGSKRRLNNMRGQVAKQALETNFAENEYLGDNANVQMSRDFHAYQTELEEKAIKGIEAEIRQDKSSYNPENLATRLKNCNAAGDVQGAIATKNVMFRSKEGMEAFYQAITEMEDDGTMNHAVATGMSQHMMDHDASDMKVKDRAIFDWAKNNQTTAAGHTNMAKNHAFNIDSLKASTMFEANDGSANYVAQIAAHPEQMQIEIPEGASDAEIVAIRKDKLEGMIKTLTKAKESEAYKNADTKDTERLDKALNDAIHNFTHVYGGTWPPPPPSP